MTCETSRTHELDPNESYTEGIIRVMAEVHDQDPSSLPPLYEAIDPDALETILQSQDTGDTTQMKTVKFVYKDHTVTVDNGGTIHITPE